MLITFLSVSHGCRFTLCGFCSQTEAALALLGITSIALLFIDLLIEHGLLEILLKLLDSPSCDVREEVCFMIGRPLCCIPI